MKTLRKKYLSVALGLLIGFMIAGVTSAYAASNPSCPHYYGNHPVSVCYNTEVAGSHYVPSTGGTCYIIKYYYSEFGKCDRCGEILYSCHYRDYTETKHTMSH